MSYYIFTHFEIVGGDHKVINDFYNNIQGGQPALRNALNPEVQKSRFDIEVFRCQCRCLNENNNTVAYGHMPKELVGKTRYVVTGKVVANKDYLQDEFEQFAKRTGCSVYLSHFGESYDWFSVWSPNGYERDFDVDKSQENGGFFGLPTFPSGNIETVFNHFIYDSHQRWCEEQYNG